MDRKMAITICGGGSLELVCAGVFLSKYMRVNMLTGHPNNWGREIKVYDLDGSEYAGSLNKVHSSLKGVIPESDLVSLTLPGYKIEKSLKEIKPYLKRDAIVGSVVSSTGFFFIYLRITGLYSDSNECHS